MKITQKTYVLLGIIIGISSINLYLLIFSASQNQDSLHSISVASNLKAIVERIAGTANSIASGNENDRSTLANLIDEFENDYNLVGHGGNLNNLALVPIPDDIKPVYDKVGDDWIPFKVQAEKIRQESVFDPKIRDDITYVLGKNGELISLSNSINNDLSPLDRNFNRHKEISQEMVTLAKDIGEKTLLYSIGQSGNATQDLTKDRVMFSADLEKLTGMTLNDPIYDKFGIKNENLAPIPRENAGSIREIGPLWDSLNLKISFMESNTLFSKDFGTALSELNSQKKLLLDTTDNFVNQWNGILDSKLHDKVVIVEVLIIMDVIVFAVVLYSIQRSLSPLDILVNAVSRIKEGFYGETITYKSNDEVGTLAETINSMSLNIQKKEEEAKKVEIAKNEFLAMVTHELKTPLVPIQGYSDILLGEHLGQLNQIQKERLKIISSSATSLLQLISDLLDAQKLELGQLRIKMDKYNIRDTINKAVVEMSPQALSDEISLTSNLTHDVILSYDDSRIKQVLTNLIKNSLKATIPKQGKVEIITAENPEEVVISVKDNGRGIPDDARDKIFKRFYQVDTTTTREKGGSGLGLSICKGIIEAHGGRIWLESQVSKGTTFSFTLPKNNTNKTPV